MSETTVWVLQVGHYDDAHVLGVFSDLESARGVPVQDDECYKRGGVRIPASEEWSEDFEPGGWYRCADGGWITSHVLNSAVFPSIETRFWRQ